MATCKNRAWQAARSTLICKQGVVGSSPIISTQQTEVSAQQQRGADLRGLIQERGAESALLLGADLGLLGGDDGTRTHDPLLAN